RSVQLPRNIGVGDFTLGPDGTIYIYATPVGAGQRKLWALTPSGRLRWQAPITRELSNADGTLRVGPDGALYTIRHRAADAGMLAGGDLVVAIEVTRQSKAKFLWEQQVLRLTSTGAIKQRYALAARAAWDPDGTTVSTQLRIGRDGRLYQLRTDPTRGASVA